jgi:hypothetical protein
MALILAASMPATVWAQTTGDVRGTVLDVDGSPLPGVTVTVESDVLLGGSRSMVTGVNGGYSFTGLPLGRYTVVAQMSGFRTTRVENVLVSVSSISTVHFTLELPGVAEEVTVVGAAPVIDIASSSVPSTYDAELIEDLPKARNFYDLIQLSPGMSNSDQKWDRTVAFGSNQQSNVWLVDGINQTAPESGSSWTRVNPEAIQEVQVLGIGAPAEFGNATGGVFNVVTKQGGNRFRGSVNMYWQPPALTDTNVELENTPYPTYARNKYVDGSGTLGGPIKRDRLWFFSAVQFQRDNAAQPGLNPDVQPDQVLNYYLGKLSSRIGDNNFLNATFHTDYWDWPYVTSPRTTPSASSGEQGHTYSWSADWRTILSDRTYVEARYGGFWGNDWADSWTGSTEPAFIDYTPPDGGPATYSGGVWWPWSYTNSNQTANVAMSHYADDFLAGDHDFRLGVEYSRGKFDTRLAGGYDGTYYYHWGGYYAKVEGDPYAKRGLNTGVSAFIDDTWSIGNDVTLNLGVRFDHNGGEFPDEPLLTRESFGDIPQWRESGEYLPGFKVVDWNNISPRIGAAWAPFDDGSLVVRGFYGTFYDGNVAGNWSTPPPSGSPILQQWWYNPASGLYEWPGWSYEAGNSGFDPDLRAPRTDQVTFGIEKSFADTFSVGAQYIYKYSKDLVGWELVGGVWDEVPFTDPFTGQGYTLLSMVEQPIYRKGNSPGVVAPGGEDKYWQRYQGLVFTFRKRPGAGGNWGLYASYTYSKSEGVIPTPFTQTQNNPLYGSRAGADPNAWINAKQRLQGDRPHMFRVVGTLRLPWEIDFNGVLNLQSGRPYNRQIQVFGLGQGIRNVVMEPAGSTDELRHQFQSNIDLAFGKRFIVGANNVFRIDVQVFNLLNADWHDYWQTQVLFPGQQLIPTNFVAPRRVMIRGGFEF